MSARQLSLNEELQSLVPDDKREPASGWNITLKVDIHADTRRLFNALIEPEYRELWLRLPGQAEADGLAASQTGNLFRLDYFRNSRLDLSIVGAYRTCRTRKIVCSWWKSSFNSTVTSVDFRLDGNFGHTILRLNHRGLVSRDEYLWHRELWRGSLWKLRCIFQDPFQDRYRGGKS